MANPFLVLGGIAVGVVTATFGLLQVPGWVASAQDAAAQNDLAQISIVQATAGAKGLGALSLAQANDPAVKDQLGVNLTLSSGVTLCLSSDDADNYAALAVSASGRYFARINGGDIGSGATEGTALDRAGGLPAGLPAPGSDEGACTEELTGEAGPADPEPQPEPTTPEPEPQPEPEPEPTPPPLVTPTLGDPVAVTGTNVRLAYGVHGVYGISSTSNLFLVDEGTPKVVTGDVQSTALRQAAGVGVAADGTQYALATTGDYVTRITPDGYTEQILVGSATDGTNVKYITNSPDGSITVMKDGASTQKYYQLDGDADALLLTTNYAVSPATFATNDAGDILFYSSSTGGLQKWVAATGQTVRMMDNSKTIAAYTFGDDPDEVYYSVGSGLYRVDGPMNSVRLYIPNSTANDIRSIVLDPEGNVYCWNAGYGYITKHTPDNQVTVWARNSV